MIQQAELQALAAERTVVADLERHPKVALYLAAQKRLDGQISRLKARVDEKVEAGPFELKVKRSPSVSWERFWSCIAGLASVARAISKDPDAQDLVAGLTSRDPKLPWVSERVSIDVVPAAAPKA